VSIFLIAWNCQGNVSGTPFKKKALSGHKNLAMANITVTQDWKLNPRLGRILHYANLFVLGSVGFTPMLAAMTKAGMSFPGNWDSIDLQGVEEILHQEIEKARSMFEVSRT
jgi:hypothetical protein